MEAGPAVYRALRNNVEKLCEQLDELENRQEVLLASIGTHRGFLSEADLVAQALGGRSGDGCQVAERPRSSLAAVRATMRKLPGYRAKCNRAKAAMAACEGQLGRLQLRVEKLRVASTAAALAEDAGVGGGAQQAALVPLREIGLFAFRVAYRGGVAVRRSPALEAPSTGEVLPCGTVFWAEERLCPVGSSGQTVFVRLPPTPDHLVVEGGGARGWVFEAKQSKSGERQTILERVSMREAQRLLGEDMSSQSLSSRILSQASPPPQPEPPQPAAADGSLHDEAAGAMAPPPPPPPPPPPLMAEQHDLAGGGIAAAHYASPYQSEEPLDSDLYDAL